MYFRILMTNSLFYIEDGVITQKFADNSILEESFKFCEQWSSGQERFIINTSGSTGKPKQIEITRTQMQASAKMTAQALSLNSGDNALVCLNTSFIAGKMMLVRGMVNKLNLYITEPSSNPLIDLPNDLLIDFIAVVPMQLETIIDSGKVGIDLLNKMKAVIVGGATVSHSLSEKIKRLTCPVYATYGMTETVSHIALKKLNGTEASDYFMSLDDVKIGLDDRGCLTINSILTNHETIITNDIVNLIDNHSFEWLGRADHVINSGGLKIHPEQLENQIRQILIEQDIDCNLIIAGIPEASLGEKVVLILEDKYLASDILNSIKSSLKESLPEYHAPKEIYLLEGFEYTETGKVKRKETTRIVPKKGVPE